MKAFFVALFLLTASFSYAQMPVKEGKVTYEVIDSVQGSKAQIYNRAKMWFAAAFKDAKEVIQVDDKESGELMGKGAFRFSYTYFANIDCRAVFTLHISARDGKYRAILTDIITEQGTSRVQAPIETINDKPDKKYNKKIISAVEKGVTDLLEDLQKKMRATSDGF